VREFYISVFSEITILIWNKIGMIVHLMIVFNGNVYKGKLGPSWSWSYGSWIYNYLCNRYISPLVLWVRISIRARSTTLCDEVCQWLATGRWFSPGTQVFSTNKTDIHDIAELSKVASNTIKPNQSIRNPKQKQKTPMGQNVCSVLCVNVYFSTNSNDYPITNSRNQHIFFVSILISTLFILVVL
jgi:hypothetical protein